MSGMDTEGSTLPIDRSRLATGYRGMPNGLSYGFSAPAAAERAADEPSGDEPRVMFGHFAVFGQWTTIDSHWEGCFQEQISPGAFKKTLAERADHIRVLFQHGRDPQIGDKPLGRPEVLREDKNGAYYEVPLLKTSYCADIVPGLEAGVYGVSFRFRVQREEWDEEPGITPDNPKGLPRRWLKELRIEEFGPVTFPAYEGASVGLRSLTDAMREGRARPGVLLAAAASAAPTPSAAPGDASTPAEGGDEPTAPSKRAAAGPDAGTAPVERRDPTDGDRPVPFYGTKQVPKWRIAR